MNRGEFSLVTMEYGLRLNNPQSKCYGFGPPEKTGNFSVTRLPQT